MADNAKERLEALQKQKESMAAEEKQLRNELKQEEVTKAKEAIAGYMGRFPKAQDVAKILEDAGFAKLEVVYSVVDGQPNMDYTPKRASGGGEGGARGPASDLKGMFTEHANEDEQREMAALVEEYKGATTKDQKAEFNRKSYMIKKKVQKRLEKENEPIPA